MSQFSIKALDHIVLTVKSIPATIQFYTQVLGLKAETFESATLPRVTRHALRFGEQKINLHQSGSEFEPKALAPKPGSADFCFLTDTPVEDFLAHVKSAGIAVLEEGQIVNRTGAHGQLRSFYIRDPDGNLVE